MGKDFLSHATAQRRNVKSKEFKWIAVNLSLPSPSASSKYFRRWMHSEHPCPYGLRLVGIAAYERA